MLQATGLLDVDEIYIVPRNYNTWLKIMNHFKPPSPGAVTAGINLIASRFTKTINEGFGVFSCTRKMFKRICRAIAGYRLKFAAYVSQSCGFVKLAMAAVASATQQGRKLFPVKTRPSVRHHPVRGSRHCTRH